MLEMKKYFLSFVVPEIWMRRKYAYFAVSVISIAANLVVLVGPTVQTSILPYIRELQTIWLSQMTTSTIGSLQTAFQAASTIGALQTSAWNALPQFAELVMQRSVLYIFLNLILARIVFKSGMLAAKTSSQSASSKQEDLCAVRNLKVVCGSHWLAPMYLHTVYSTMSNFVDVSAGSPMLLQHSHHSHGRGSPATTDDALKPQIQVQGHLSAHSLQKHSLRKSARSLPATPSPAPSRRPSLFTIEPLEELVQSMQPPQAPIAVEAPMSRHPLRKVATKVDLVQALRVRRRKESRLKADEHQQRKESRQKADKHQQQKSGRTRQGVEEKHGIKKMKEHNMGQSMKQSKVESVGGGAVAKGQRSVEDDGDVDNQLSGQEFNKRVETFICKGKILLTDSLDFIRQDAKGRGADIAPFPLVISCLTSFKW
ncbi:hypothetical protein L7F22_021848 [Adiantum nelumboides]|nr:hypothetical protein [Adiantum nelumboides]